VHERHAADLTLPRLSGWFGHDLADRFRMPPVFRPTPSADAWQLSNPPILALAPVLASLRIFDAVGMPALRARSLRLTGYLQRLLEDVITGRPLSVITPRDPHARGCQLSVRVLAGDAAMLVRDLRDHHGVIADVRRPDVIRFAPVPLYSTFHDCWRAADALAQAVAEEA
jgi:kynureninase